MFEELHIILRKSKKECTTTQKARTPATRDIVPLASVTKPFIPRCLAWRGVVWCLHHMVGKPHISNIHWSVWNKRNAVEHINMFQSSLHASRIGDELHCGARKDAPNSPPDRPYRWQQTRPTSRLPWPFPCRQKPTIASGAYFSTTSGGLFVSNSVVASFPAKVRIDNSPFLLCFATSSMV